MPDYNSAEEAAKRHREDPDRQPGAIDTAFHFLTNPFLHVAVVGGLTWWIGGSLVWALIVSGVLAGWFKLTGRF